MTENDRLRINGILQSALESKPGTPADQLFLIHVIRALITQIQTGVYPAEELSNDDDF